MNGASANLYDLVPDAKSPISGCIAVRIDIGHKKPVVTDNTNAESVAKLRDVNEGDVGDEILARDWQISDRLEFTPQGMVRLGNDNQSVLYGAKNIGHNF